MTTSSAKTPGLGKARQTLRSLDALAAAGLIETSDDAVLAAVAKRYAIAISPAVIDMIDAADPRDPIGRQFIPDHRERETMAVERADPIGDGAHEATPGLVHRYPDRVLLKLVHTCPVYCRFCFRREMVGPGNPGLAGADLDHAIAYIAGTPAIWEVVITGGDPFILAPRRIKTLMQRLAAIDHVKVIRWHSRVPMVAPERITPAFARALRTGNKPTYVAIHANHPAEFTPAARKAIDTLADAGLVLVSQSVLLRGVNADIETLTALMRAFVETRVKPYYLHHPDLAPGTAHFRLSLAEGQQLVRQLRGTLSGLCQPTYVLDIPGGYGKVPIGPSWTDLTLSDDGTLRIEDIGGQFHIYPPNSDQTAIDSHLPKADRRPGADMADNLGGSERAEPQAVAV